jgi:hypothetical protein
MAMMKWTHLAAVAATALALSACETATPYQPLGTGSTSGGYSDHQIEANRFTVSFSGNSVTSRETVERYLLYRAAELTLNLGYDWFEAEDRHTDQQTQVYSDPWVYGAGWGGGYWGPRWRIYRHGYWGYWDPWMGRPFDVETVTRYTASAEIAMGRGPKPAGDRRAFDAHQVIEHLGPSIQRPSV